MGRVACEGGEGGVIDGERNEEKKRKKNIGLTPNPRIGCGIFGSKDEKWEERGRRRWGMQVGTHTASGFIIGENGEGELEKDFMGEGERRSDRERT